MIKYVIIALFAIGIIPVFADTGINFDKTEVKNADGTVTGYITLFPDSYIQDYDGKYKPYTLTQDANIIQVETAQGSFVYDKNNCAISFFNSGHITQDSTPVIGSDSFVLKGALVNSNNWQPVNTINNAACQTVLHADGSTIQIDGIKKVNNTGTLKVSWIKKEFQPLKTNISITNSNPAWTNNKVGLTETINVPRIITVDNSTFDLSQYNNVKLDRQWMITHKAMLAKLTDKINYDFSLAFPYFSNMTIYWNGSQASLAFDYLNSNQRIPIGFTASVDPAFGYNSGTNYEATTSATTATTCGTPTSITATGTLTNPISSSSGACTREAYQYSISSLAGTVIDNVVLTRDITATNGANCDVNQMQVPPSGETVSQLWADIANGNSYLSNSSACATTGTNIINDLGSNAVSDLQTAVNQGNATWGIGIKYHDETRGTSTRTEAYSNVKIAVSYHTSTPSTPLSIVATPEYQKVLLSYSMPNYKGSSSISNYDLYKSAVPYGGRGFPNFGQTDPGGFSGALSMTSNILLYHFNNNLNDSSGNSITPNVIGLSYSINKTGGLVYYNFEQPTGNLVNEATSANGFTSGLGSTLNMTPSATTTQNAAGKVGNYAWDFTTGKATGTRVFSGLAKASISFWFKLDNYATTDGSLTDEGNYAGSDWEYGIKYDHTTGSIVTILSPDGNALAIGTSAAGTITDNNWHYYTLVYDGTQATNALKLVVYVDTAQKALTFTGSAIPSSIRTATANTFYIGHYASSTGGATIDEFSGWNRKLTASEISATYNSGSGISYIQPDSSSVVYKTKGVFSQSFITGVNGLNITSSSLPVQGTNQFSLFGFVNRTSSSAFNLLSYNTTTKLPVVISENATYISIKKGSTYSIQKASTSHTNSINFIVITRNSTAYSVYVNGTLIGGTTNSSSIGVPKNNSEFLGANVTGNGGFSSGNIDEFGMMSRALSQTEITNMQSRWANPLVFMQQVGNVTSITDSNLANNSTYYYGVGAVNSNGNGTISNTIEGTTATVPSTPTNLKANAISKTEIDLYWTAPSAGGDENGIEGYKINRNGTLLVNDTHSTTPLYQNTGLTENRLQSYTICAWNRVGCSTLTSSVQNTTYTTTTGTVYVDKITVGDVVQLNGTIYITNASPVPVTLSLLKLYHNSTSIQNQTLSSHISTLTNYTQTPFWFQFTNNSTQSFTISAVVSNDSGTVQLDSGTVTASRQYDPSYFTATDSSLGQVNYTISRSANQATLFLAANRNLGGSTFPMECLYQTASQAQFGGNSGTWVNRTNIGYWYNAMPVSAIQFYYVSCYDPDHLLFTTSSLVNGSSILFGISGFDSTFGAFLGLPTGVFFVVMAAALGNRRTAPMWVVIILAIAGMMATIGFFTLDQNVWYLAIIAGLLGLFVGRKLF